LNMDNFIFGKNSVAIDGNLIKNLSVSDTENSGDWHIVGSISENDVVFGDRDFTFTSMPEALSGAEYIRTACDSKNSNENLAEFIANEDITLYIALDNRVETLPEWLKNFTKTDMTVSYSNDVTADIYSMNYSSGDKITLGTNGQSAYCVNYTAFVRKAENIVIGDVNNDGKFNVSDAVILQKWLINASDELVNWQNTDLHKDNKIDVFDLVMMKKLLVSGK
ncbi:MAG: dockerin type I repeat-containing protein, partial [Ruminococcus sp.]|nr:dockerin type I repeat-containing protein [Ruminococcus sp.]